MMTTTGMAIATTVIGGPDSLSSRVPSPDILMRRSMMEGTRLKTTTRSLPTMLPRMRVGPSGLRVISHDLLPDTLSSLRTDIRTSIHLSAAPRGLVTITVPVMTTGRPNTNMTTAPSGLPVNGTIDPSDPAMTDPRDGSPM